MPDFELLSRVEEDRVVLDLRGDLDLGSAAQVESEVARLLEDGVGTVVLDLRNLAFMDSSGLRSVLRAEMLSRELGRRLALVDAPGPVRRVFELTGMYERLTFVAHPTAAVPERA